MKPCAGNSEEKLLANCSFASGNIHGCRGCPRSLQRNRFEIKRISAFGISSCHRLIYCVASRRRKISSPTGGKNVPYLMCLRKGRPPECFRRYYSGLVSLSLRSRSPGNGSGLPKKPIPYRTRSETPSPPDICCPGGSPIRFLPADAASKTEWKRICRRFPILGSLYNLISRSCFFKKTGYSTKTFE